MEILLTIIGVICIAIALYCVLNYTKQKNRTAEYLGEACIGYTDLIPEYVDTHLFRNRDKVRYTKFSEPLKIKCNDGLYYWYVTVHIGSPLTESENELGFYLANGIVHNHEYVRHYFVDGVDHTHKPGLTKVIG